MISEHLFLRTPLDGCFWVDQLCSATHINSATTQSNFPSKTKETPVTPIDRVFDQINICAKDILSVGRIVSIMKHKTCLYVYLRSGELHCIKNDVFH